MIGLAVGESEHGITTPRAPIKASGTLIKDAEALIDIARKEQVQIIVLGVPLNLPGKSDRMQKVCGQLADRLREKGVEVKLVDEALTSVEAEEILGQKSTTQRRDAHGEAARLILERFFNGG